MNICRSDDTARFRDPHPSPPADDQTVSKLEHSALILGSASPRRLQLLAQIGIIPHDIRPADIDETPHKAERAADYALRMATEKSNCVRAIDGETVLTADTVVTAGRRILGKPEDEGAAHDYLTLLSGRRHRVVTAVCVRRGGWRRVRNVETIVRMRPLTRAEIEGYLASGEWRGKAGSYAIQGRAGAFVSWISGSFTSIVGLPLSETSQLLRAAQLESRNWE